ncbi:YhdP family protein [Marinobacter salicampi]|uniref:YhdP family protein n=1 Tax=Marinobacter salicampi TaxID=435907 RepID=UPI00140A251E|nr:YhdP family protein [Marinobacter salicampi]
MSTPPAESGSGNSFLRPLLRLANLVWWLVLVVLVLLALYAGLGRQLTQHIDSYRDQLEQKLSQEAGRKITIDQLDASWQWLDPIIRAEGLTLYHEDEPERVLAELQHLRIRLDTLSSLLRFRIVFDEFEADGLDFTLTRREAGPVQVGGIRVLDPSGPNEWLDRLGRILSDPFVRITRINLGLKVPNEPVQHVDIPQVDLIYEQGVFTATGRAMHSGSTNQIASFILQGKHFFRGDFDGQLYVDLDSGRLFDGMLRGYGWGGMALQGFDVKGQGWLTFENGELVRGNSFLDIPHLQLSVGNETLAPLEDISAQVGWRASENGSDTLGDLHINDLTWRWAGTEATPFNIRVTRKPNGFGLSGDRWPMRPLAHLATSLQLLPAQASNALANYQPSGLLNEVLLSVVGSEEALAEQAPTTDFQLTAQLSDVDVAAYGGAPGASGIAGQLFVNRDSGWVELDSTDAELGLPQLFTSPWTLPRLTGRVAWLLEGGRTRVFSDDIHIEYRDDAELEGAFDLLLEPGAEDVLGLQVKLLRGNASMLEDFVPPRILGEALYRWLTTAIEHAHISEGVFYGHGVIGGNGSENAFTTSMRYDFSEASVRYDPAWPAVTDVAGHATVNGTQAYVELASARTAGIELQATRINVTEGPRIRVDTGAQVSGSVARDWLIQTPLAEQLGGADELITLAGDYDLVLGLELPLGSEAEVQVDAEVATENGEVSIPETGLVWSAITGEISYQTGQGFSSEPLSGLFLGHPVDIRFAEEQDRLTVSQRGRTSVADLSREADFQLPESAGITGAFNYIAQLVLEPGEGAVVTVESSMQGVSVDWPTPLDKPADSVAPMKLWANWRGDDLKLFGHWEERLAGRLSWRAGAFQRGRLSVGSGTADLPDDQGLEIEADFGTLDVSQWQDRQQALQGDKLPEPGKSGPGVPEWVSRIRISADQLLVAGESFPGASVVATPEGGRWVFDVDSEHAAGTVMLPADDTEQVVINLSHLTLEESENPDEGDVPAPDEPAAEVAGNFQAWGVGKWPGMRVNVDAFARGTRRFGAWSFDLEPQSDVLYLKNLRGALADLRFNGEMSWRDLPDGEQTQLTGRLEGGSLEGLSSALRGEVPLKNKKTMVEMELAWPGGPANASPPAMDGTISLRLDEGVILESNNTAQLFRVFNLLNSDTIWRRLKLDFSDLYEAGVAFDAVSGKAALGDGFFHWQPELQIAGPSGAFKLSGSSNLIEETLDMRLVVVLPLTQNLPLAALLMGASAPIGGALFVLDKILGDPLSKLTSATYSVKGTWGNPEVSLRNVFDTGK